MKNNILVPTDLTEAADKAIAQAIILARKMEAGIILVHVLTDRSEPAEVIEMTLNAQGSRTHKKTGIICETRLLRGGLFTAMEKYTKENPPSLMVVGTHGIRGLRQKLLGADILKLVSRVHVPSLVVQKTSPLIEKLSRIVLPAASHSSFHASVDIVARVAEVFHSEVHLYTVEKPGFDWPDQLVRNIQEATRVFNARKIKLKRVNEEQSVYSQGYAKQTLKYARSVHADTICIMAVPSREYHYFAQSDKESILLNEDRIPILCAGGGTGKEQ